MGNRSGSDEVRRAITTAIRDGFQHDRVPGLDTTPSITQNPTRQTTEPYIYIYSLTESEIDVTKEDSSREYVVSVEVCLRYRSYIGGQRQANRIVDEILSVIRGFGVADYPDISDAGYRIYRITSGEIETQIQKDRGANYYKAIFELFVTAEHIGIPDEVLPIQTPGFTYSDWMFTPVNNNIERWDSGNIIPTTTYPSSNNGWDFIDASFSISSGDGGTYDGTTYAITSGVDDIGMDSTLRYELNADTTERTSIQQSVSWNRIDSIRYGSIVPVTPGTLPILTDDTADTYGLRDLTNWNIEFGTVTPHNETIVITGDSNEYVYIIVDSGVTLSQIRNAIGQNTIAQWDVETVGNYKIYINNQPIVFDGFSTEFTLTAS